MLQPFLCSPWQVEDFDAEKVKTAVLQCMCGHTRNLRDCCVVWTHKAGTEYAWYACCGGNCYTANVTEGNC